LKLMDIGNFSAPGKVKAVMQENKNPWNAVKASSFADLADLKAFERCRAGGGSENYCFGFGDNGIGFSAVPVENDNTWVPTENDGDGRISCATEEVCACALPPEVWQAKWGGVKAAAGKRLQVRYKGKIVDGILGDTMPHIANIKNGARIDLNPGFAKALGVRPPFLINVEWRWA